MHETLSNRLSVFLRIANYQLIEVWAVTTDQMFGNEHVIACTSGAQRPQSQYCWHPMLCNVASPIWVTPVTACRYAAASAALVVIGSRGERHRLA